MGINDLEKVSLGYFPTPFDLLARLSDEIGGPAIWVKRDDLTGLCFGGSKTRALEYLIGDAVKKGADTVITCGPVTSNHVRLTAAAARKAGLKCSLVIKNDEHSSHEQGNMLLNKMLGAEMVLCDVESLGDLDPIMEQVYSRFVSENRRPYIIPGGGYSPIGSAGYVGLVDELRQQSAERGIKIDAVMFASGSGCIQSGLIVGDQLLGTRIDVIGLTINRDSDVLSDRVYNDVQETFGVIGDHRNINKNNIVVLDKYRGRGYAIPSVEGQEAIRHVAELEGMLLDPCYTGKTMAGVIDLAKTCFHKGQNVVFIHTGGSPGIFTYGDMLAQRR